MTTPLERTRSLFFALELLEQLGEERLPAAEARRQAQAVLRHFPNRTEIGWLAVQVERSCNYPMLAPLEVSVGETLPFISALTRKI